MSKVVAKESFLVKFIRFGIYITVFAVPLLVFRDFISPFHFGKVIAFRSLVEILGASYLVLILKDRSYLPRRDNVFWVFLLFTLAFTLATITSVLKYPSFWGTLERMGGLWTFWHYFLFFIILTSVLNKRRHWQRILDLVIFAGVLSAFYGFAQKTDIDFFLGSGDRARIFGTIGNAALFAGYELFSVFLALTMYLRSGDSQSRKITYLLAFVITSVAVLMTAVRGSLLGFVVGLTIFAFLWMRRPEVAVLRFYGAGNRSHVGKLIFKILIGLIVFFVFSSWLFGGASFVKNSGYLSRVTNFSLTATTVQTRFWAWQAGLKGWIESPKTVLLGWGPENFNIPFSKNFNPKFFRGPGAETLFDRAHNMFVEVLVTMGIVGLAAYMSIFVVLFLLLRKLLANKEFAIYGIGFISAIITYIIHNSFIFDTSANFVVFFTILGFLSYLDSQNKESLFAKAFTDTKALADRSRNKEGQYEVQPIIKNKLLISIIGMILVIFVSGLIYKTNILPVKANYATTRAIVRGWEGDFKGSIEKYKEALTYDVPGKYDYRHRLAQYLVGVGGPSVKEEFVRNVYEYTIAEVEKNIEENSIDYLPYLYASRLNIMLGKDDPKSSYNDKALGHSMKALELSPTFVRTYYEIAQAYLNKRDYPKAIESFQKAVDLNPDTGISYGYLGATKIESGDLGGAEDLEKALNSKNPYSPREADFQRLIGAYLKTNNFVRIAWVYEQLIIVNPKNPQHYASLATAYANLGRIEDAVIMARKAVEVDPSFEPDARIFLKSLGRDL
ncbi:MAG: O-antigen ligase family protein [Parcubacteria group bacterium]|nr:O-antigen ligase family protein [Parcubacteria group bacterium]